MIRIVTGDEDLLVLDPFEGARIVRPHVFLAALK
jgi:predicted nucleic acid-binding protein